MNIKRLLSLILVFCISFALCNFSWEVSAAQNIDLSKLCAFGILENEVDDLSRPVSRIEMVRFVSALYGKEVSYIEGETNYVDVEKDHEYAGENAWIMIDEVRVL